MLTVARDAGAVAPLYRHVFAIAGDHGGGGTAGSLSFVGLPFKVAPFRCFELQATWIAQVLAAY